MYLLVINGKLMVISYFISISLHEVPLGLSPLPIQFLLQHEMIGG